ncbi:MAG: hypothetical protein MUF15_17040, partial [Acidobacteria bacterium]|nr:hypothetical protein [Acidobacteriota bacterium]
YDIKDIEEEEAQTPEPPAENVNVQNVETVETSETAPAEQSPAIMPPAPEIKTPILETMPPAAPIAVDVIKIEEEEDEGLPYLENEMILLPCPKDDDISSYMMTIGSGSKNIQFYTNSLDNEVSILTTDKDEKILKRKIDDKIEFSTKMDSIQYSVSNSFMSRIDDKELKLYFAWELESNIKERIYLKRDFYVLGREPLDNLAMKLKSQTKPGAFDRLIYLNKGDEDFWRIGASRDHALLLKKDDKFMLFNISLSYPVYIIKPTTKNKPLILPARLEPVPNSEKQDKLSALLEKVKEAAVNDLLDHPETCTHLETLPGIVNGVALENNDLIVIGNKVFKFIVPIVMESVLSDRVRRSILRKIQFKDSVLRK